MTKPCIGPASQIIEQALHLGLLCRPLLGHTSAIGVGEALELTEDGFYRVGIGCESLVPYSVSPADLIRDWELTNLDLLRSEWNKACEAF